MKNTQINRAATIRIANALGELNEKAIFVGGAVVSLYIDDPSAEDVRPTKDIDISLEIANVGELERVRETLTKKGFIQSPEDNVICRFRYDDIKVDVMSIEPVGWAPANPWFAIGLPFVAKVKLYNVEIKILPLPYFLATKFSAFKDRGGNDPRASHDFEDIVYLLNYTKNIKKQIQDCEKKLQDYLKSMFSEIINSSQL
jgi:predicted nucleotidyltransferase